MLLEYTTLLVLLINYGPSTLLKAGAISGGIRSYRGEHIHNVFKSMKARSKSTEVSNNSFTIQEYIV
jgi:hypothetical protein